MHVSEGGGAGEGGSAGFRAGSSLQGGLGLDLQDSLSLLFAGFSQQPALRAHVMKQILLGVAVVGGEVFLDECMQLLGGGIAAGEVELAQGFYDPGIKREGLGMGVGEEEDAVSNLGADAGQALEFGLGRFII